MRPVEVARSSTHRNEGAPEVSKRALETLSDGVYVPQCRFAPKCEGMSWCSMSTSSKSIFS